MANTPTVPLVSLLDLAATDRQRRDAFLIAAVLLVIFLISAPFANLQFPRYDGYVPAVESMVLVNDLITSILLLAHYLIKPSRAILALALSYLYAALIVIPHILTFPGAFTATGLLGAGSQTSAWLYYLWGAGPPLGAILYCYFKGADGADHLYPASANRTVIWSIVAVICLVVTITWVTTAKSDLLPVIVSRGDHYAYAVAYVVSPLAIFVMVSAIVALWIKRNSVLDYWLMLAIFALILQHIYGGFLATGRYTLGFYASRGFTLVTSTLVLALLLNETANLYARLARANVLLERERNNKLINLEVMAASIVHELAQPLGAISLNAETVGLLIDTKPQDPKVKSVLDRIGEDCKRLTSTVTSMRSLFKRDARQDSLCDVNQVIASALAMERSELAQHGISVEERFDPGIPPLKIDAHQLQQVLLNLLTNAIDAMRSVASHNRVLRVTSEVKESEAVLSIQDSGVGIPTDNIEAIFEPMFTTKGAGMGMGLWICRTIVETYGGQLKAWSRVDHGSIFQIVLPIRS